MVEPKPVELSARDRVNEEIKELEKLIANTKYNKKTQHAIGLYKAKLASLKQKAVARSSSGKKGQGYAVQKSGDATVIIIGFPSVGKSTLLNALTDANSRVASYEFTTLTVIPGLLKYNNAKIQILDVPGIIEGAAAGTGRGKEVLSVIQNSDMILFVVDAMRPDNYRVLQKEVYDSNIRVNQRKPDIKIKKVAKGGIDFGATVRLNHLTKETVTGILREFRIMNAQVLVREDITADQFIDAIEGNKKYLPSVTILNKIDMVDQITLDKIKQEIKPDLCVSAELRTGINELKKLIFDKLNFIRVYTKEVNKKPDLNEPMIMKNGVTIKDVCEKLHRDFVSKFKYAKIWGKSSKFPGQILHLEHKLMDRDVIEIHLR